MSAASLKNAVGNNIGHAITIMIAVGAVLVAWGKMDQRQTETERRMTVQEIAQSDTTNRLARIEGKIDVLMMPGNQRSTAK
jgi:poly-beta-1,6-N-acetyl-D-glucosamine biosynthesis protein PgaD